jgi:hypothetical protein
VPAQVKDRDEQLAKAKRMMVALNNKFKAKFAKMEETYKAKAAAPGEGEGSAPSLELQEARDKLAAAQRAVQELQQALAAERARGGAGENDGEIAELQEAVEERDAIIEKAKEKYQEMGRKARAAVEERDAEIATLQEQLQQAEQKLEEALGAAAASASSDEALAQMQASLDEANAALSVAQCSCSEAQQVLILNKYLLSIVTRVRHLVNISGALRFENICWSRHCKTRPRRSMPCRLSSIALCSRPQSSVGRRLKGKRQCAASARQFVASARACVRSSSSRTPRRWRSARPESRRSCCRRVMPVKTRLMSSRRCSKNKKSSLRRRRRTGPH